MTDKEKFIKAAELAALWEDNINQISVGALSEYIDANDEVFHIYIGVYKAFRKLNQSFPEAASILMSEAYA